MELREAILRAADTIEAHPNLYDYHSIEVPDESCGTPGCALGWIAHYLGYGVQVDYPDVLYWTMDEAFKARFPSAADCCFTDLTEFLHSDEWQKNTGKCAAGLRGFAQSL